MNRLLEILNKININSTVSINENMAKHTTFKCGGDAEIFIMAKNSDDVLKIKRASIEYDFPLFILGGGANILVSDKGISGITLCMNELISIKLENNDKIIVDSGLSINSICEYAYENSLSGLEFIYGMPGSVGGAVWMNARCYGSEISDIFLWAEYINEEGQPKRIYKENNDWEYKISPFQNKELIITKVAFQLKPGKSSEIKFEMNKNRNDRRVKGHFSYPCAGSVFKNNRLFGSPSGKIIEDAGLKGLRKGNAQISDFHANIIVNLGDAKSSDIDYLINKVIKTVYETQNLILEPEVLKIGNWEY